ncbi:sulfotransferase family protein [Aureispira anguillae]|uniref:Sulfotransferase n=1 Tax=Aureispira anguillae TaxID=2864201 RepID=A0A915YHC9_9BACT|nr:sulfotransferase [Aureispira anguillae]BDS13184.1 sulfotransferase [Aureispira anguillae]
MAKIKENPKANYDIPGSQLYVTRVSNLWKLFGENKTSKSKIPLKLRIYFFSIISTPLQWLQRLILMFKFRNFDLSKTSPVFILGHWRSGTTHVHYTLAKDKQFAYLNNFQSFFFSISMLGMGWLNKLLGPLVPSTRPMDNMEMTLSKPQEEEQVLSNITTAAGVNSFYFPKNRSYFYKYNLFQGISNKEYAKWKKDYTYILKAIAKMKKGNGRLLLKNPNNTARIKQLLELFPKAKFVFIHRNPFQVYLSTKHLHRAVLRSQRLQDISNEEEEEMILENYRLIMQGYLDTRDLVPKGSLVEIAYGDIGKEGELDVFKHIYETLELGDWEQIKPTIQSYLASKKGYKKNKFIPIDPEMVKRIQKEWGFIFEEYGYDLEYKDDTASTIAPKN